VEKFREVTALSLKFIGAHTLNFGAIFEIIVVKIVAGTPVLAEWVSKL